MARRLSRRLLGSLTLALGLALALAQPLAGQVAAHPAHSAMGTAPLTSLTSLAGRAHAAALSISKSSTGTISTPAMDLTLHYHSTLDTGNIPTFVATDAQGNVFLSDPGAGTAKMYDASDHFVRQIGTTGDLISPEGIFVLGNTVYVADFSNHQIATFDKTTGILSGTFGAGHLTGPAGVALGPNGTLYVVDNTANDIAEFSTGGAFLGSFGGGGSGDGEFNGPLGIGSGPYNALYVTDSGNHRVEVFDPSGTYLFQWGSASFALPAGIAVDRSGMVYVTDAGVQTVYKFDLGGSLVGAYSAPASAFPGTFAVPFGIAVTNVANKPIAVYVTDNNTGAIMRFDQVINPQNHTYQAQWGSLGSGTGQFSGPIATVVDLAGNVYVSDAFNNRVEKFDQFGTFLLAIDGSASGTAFNSPAGLALSPNGSTLYVADSGNNRIVEFNPTGGYIGQFGSAGSGPGQFSGPVALATDGNTIYVVDATNNRVETFDSMGNYVSQFGSLGSGAGQFNQPEGIALDSNRGELFIVDTGNNRVEVYTTGGANITSLTSAASVNLLSPIDVSTDQRGDVYVADFGNNRIVEFDVNLTRAIAFGTAGSGNGQFNGPASVAVSPASGQLYVVDLGNNRIERWGSPWPKDDTVGIYRPSTKTFYLRNENSTGPADIVVPMPYAQASDLPIVGDWNGDGVDTVGLYRTSTGNFLLQDANVQEAKPDYHFTLGNPGDTPLAGDWNGDGTSGAGIFRPSNGILYLKNSLSTGFADHSLVLGNPGDVGIAGDWNGDGQDSPGVYRPSTQRFFVTNKVTNGIVFADASAVLGVSGDVPFTGDWVGQGSSGIGVFRPTNGITYEKNTIHTGVADNFFVYGVAGDIPVAGQWFAPQILFSAPAPHVSLGTNRGSGTVPPPVLRRPAGQPAGHAPAHTQQRAPALTPRRTSAH